MKEQQKPADPPAGAHAVQSRMLFRRVAQDLDRIAQSSYVSDIENAIQLLVASFSAGGKLLVFGNGGSATDAQHICGELVGRFARNRAALPAIALSDSAAVLTAWSNDHGFETVFARQVEAFGRKGDVAWGISTSGSSPNVISALRTARDLGLRTIGLTGAGGGRMAGLCDVLMAVPLAETPRIQEIHVITYHAVCAAVEDALFGDK